MCVVIVEGKNVCGIILYQSARLIMILIDWKNGKCVDDFKSGTHKFLNCDVIDAKE